MYLKTVRNLVLLGIFIKKKKKTFIKVDWIGKKIIIKKKAKFTF